MTHEESKMLERAHSAQQIDTAIETLIYEAGGKTQEVAEDIVAALQTKHRTSQQAFWSAMLKAMLDYADSAHDLRNADAVRLCGLVRDAARKANLDYGLPRI